MNLSIAIVGLASVYAIVRVGAALRKAHARRKPGQRSKTIGLLVLYVELGLAVVIPAVVWWWTGSLRTAYLALCGYALFGFLLILVVVTVVGGVEAVHVALGMRRANRQGPP